jgi:hypothetical protein
VVLSILFSCAAAAAAGWKHQVSSFADTKWDFLKDVVGVA